MDSIINYIADIFREMVDNANHFGKLWKNIELGKKGFEMMKQLPDSVPGEFSSPAEKATILENMIEQMEPTYSPRLCIAIREYIEHLDPQDDYNKSQLAKLRDYIDLSLPMEDYCKKYRLHLKFDPVERTAEMEDVIVEVERECEQKLADAPRGLGYCYYYWSARRDALARRGIEWKSPGLMNPRVLFD